MKNYKVIEVLPNNNAEIPATNIVAVEVLKGKNGKFSKLEKFKKESIYFLKTSDSIYHFYTNNPLKYK